jgi:predicted ATPase with chaperone activity
MLARVLSGSVVGIEPLPLAGEVNVHTGENKVNIVELRDFAVKESKDWVGSAIVNSGSGFRGDGWL